MYFKYKKTIIYFTYVLPILILLTTEHTIVLKSDNRQS